MIKTNLVDICIYICIIVRKLLKSSRAGKSNLQGRRFRIRNIAMHKGKKRHLRIFDMTFDAQVWMIENADLSISPILVTDIFPHLNLIVLNKPIAAL